MARKLFLTSFILFVDEQNGSAKVLRLFLAAFVSAVYLLMLCLARPMRRTDSLYLACTANLFLVLSFLSGIIIKLCGGGIEANSGEESQCQALVGLNSHRQASLVVVVTSIVMLAATLLLIVWQASVTSCVT